MTHRFLRGKLGVRLLRPSRSTRLMEKSGSGTVRLFDAYDVLSWASITSATSKQGVPVQLEGRGYEPDRVKVRSPKGLVHDVKTSQLQVEGKELDFVGQYAHFAILNLEVSIDQLIETRQGFPRPDVWTIQIRKDQISEIQNALRSDFITAARRGLDQLSRHLTLLVGFCNAWNGCKISALKESTDNLRKSAAAPILRKFSDLLHRCLPSFQNFFLSRNNLTAAHALLGVSSPTRFYQEMSERQGSYVIKLISDLLDHDRIREASRLAEFLPNPAWKHATQEKLGRLEQELPRKLLSNLMNRLESNEFEPALNVIRTAGRESISSLDSIDLERIDSWISAITDFPEENFRHAALDLLSCGSQATIAQSAKLALANRVTEYILDHIESQNFQAALNLLIEATESTPIFHTAPAHLSTIRSAFVDQLQELKVNASTGKPVDSSWLTKLRDASALFALLGMDHSLLRELVETQLDFLKKALANRVTRPGSALNLLTELRALEDFFPQDFPVQQLDIFLQAARDGDVTHAEKQIESLSSADIPVDKMLFHAAQRTADRCIGKLDKDDYSAARALYCKHAAFFPRYPDIRAEIVSSFSACRRRRELAYFAESIEKAFGALGCAQNGFEIAQPDFERIDYAVIAGWNNLRAHDQEHIPWQWDTLQQRLGAYKFMQHFSARSAEKAALVIYGRIYKSVCDLSMQQVSSTSTDWMRADLSVAGQDEDHRHIDVKSARSSFARRDRYSEFCVKAFKENRRGSEVSLSAFFSEYRTAEQYLSGDFPTYLWLGEFTRSTCVNHIGFIEKHFGSILELDSFRRGFGSERFLPGWAFDYPDPVYESSNASLHKLRDVVARASRRNALPRNLPSPLMVLTDALLPMHESRSERLVSRALQSMVAEKGLNLFLLFMTVIAVSITAIRRGWMDFKPSLFRQYLDLEHKEDAHLIPLGIQDPLGYIDELINCLETIFERSGHEILRFRSFRLLGHGILQGRADGDSDWATILAYCGGRNQRTKVRCGNTPLVLTVHPNCKACGKLVCNECDFCSDHCPDCYNRSSSVDEGISQQGDSDPTGERS